MVSKLVFKGEKLKKRKHKSSKEKEKVKRHRHEPEGEVQPEQIEGWITATNISHINGPTVIAVSGSSSPVCLCTDDNGKVYISTDIELYGDEELAVDCVEPSNVQQVFVLTRLNFDQRIHSEEKEAQSMQFSIKSCQGRYLSADKSGVLEARATSVGPNEIFTIEKVKTRWYIKSHHSKYISIVESESEKSGYEARADNESIFELALRVQARFIRSVKAVETIDSQYLSSHQLEELAGRKLTSTEIQKLKTANREGKINEALLDLRVKSKSDSRS